MSKDLATQFDEMERVAERLHKGKSATAVGKELGISRAKVLEYQQAYNKFAVEDADIKARAKEILVGIDKHYDMLLQKTWFIIDETERNGDLKEMNNAIKTAATISKDRSQLYSAAGLTADDELADQLAQMEQEHEQIKQILKTVSQDCPRCKAQVYRALSEIKGAPEVIVVEEPRPFEDMPA